VHYDTHIQTTLWILLDEREDGFRVSQKSTKTGKA